MSDLENIVSLAKQPVPERPDGIVTMVKFSSVVECRESEPEYEQLARKNPATIFLRSFKEFETADELLGQADVSAFPTYDVFYGGNRVARLVGNQSQIDLQDVLDQYQMMNSKLDLFSESADNERRMDWANGKYTAATPRTTARFLPGYDWSKDGGFFDEAADSFESDYEDWVPNIGDD